MKYFEKVKLKDNRDCILRTPENSDAENVLALFVKMLGQSDNLALYPEENTFSLGDEKDFLAEKSIYALLLMTSWSAVPIFGHYPLR